MNNKPSTAPQTVTKFLLWLLLMFFFTSLTAQQTYFHKYLKPSYAWNVFQNNDGTYRLIGMTALESLSDSSNIVFIKLDSLGEVIYRKEISSAFADDNYHVKQVGNKFIIDGFSGNQLPDTTKAAITALDFEGNLLWHGRYGNNKNLGRYTVYLAPTIDNGFIGIGIDFNQDLLIGNNVFVYKTDSIGSFQWGKLFGTNDDESVSDIIQTSDGNFLILVWYNGTNPPSTFRPLLLKIDILGNILWTRKYNIDSNDGFIWSIKQLITKPNGNFLLLGTSIDSVGNPQPILVETTPLGIVITKQKINYLADVLNGHKTFITTKDSGYAFFTNHTAMFIEGKVYRNSLFKLDKNLNIEWVKIYPNIVSVRDLKQTNDEGFVFVGEGNGYSQTFPSIGLPLAIIKTDKFGNSGCFERDTFAVSYPVTVYDSVFTLQSYDEGFQSASSTTEFFTPMQSYTHCFCSVTGGFTFAINGDTVQFTNTSTGASSYTWNFGDGNTSNDFSPTHVYDTSGTFNVSLIVQDGICVDTIYQTITIVGVEEYDNPLHFSVYPNPSFSTNVQFVTTEQGFYQLKITDYTGKLIDNINFTGKQYTYKNKHLSTGLYFYEIINQKNVKSRGKLVRR